MTTIEPPHSLRVDAAALWRRGTGETDIRRGDLWVLSWDGSPCGHVMVAANKSDYIIGWPVTLAEEPSYAPGLVVRVTPLAVPVVLWPSRETGLGKHLLDRCLGNLLSERQVLQVAAATDAGELPGLPFARGSSSDEANSASDRTMTEHWAELCFNDPRSDTGEVVLDENKIRAAGIDAQTVGRALGLDVVATRNIWSGTKPISAPDLSRLARAVGVPEVDLTGVDPASEYLSELARPVFKSDVVDLGRKRREREGTTRVRVSREALRLAARDDSRSRRPEKLRDAIARLQDSGQSDA
ncbi:hypothetical protein CLV47_12316 [Antricoccus suffuscus]|uniref:Uncharacterized protein n=1 Tax=Antricoccus suffuscus TaxID=1629062 RepID=A0A2T0ZF38_9ACTN|nr:hypothetical protein CLV47_12316 [Antricoccus suffuscus]